MTKKKPLGTKAQMRAEKDKERRIATAIFLAIILLAAAFSVYFGYTILNSSPGLSFSGPTLQFKPENPNPDLWAAIVDQVSLTFPNQTFIQTTTGILEQANYSVDYYSGEQVTVDFYRNLPAHGYKIIILRVHSALFQGNYPPVCLFTSEYYSKFKYVQEQLTDSLTSVAFTMQPPYYFGINPDFVRSSMEGKFNSTIVIMMGCNGLTYTDMAGAFIENGAKAYISWNSSVSAGRTDAATTCLLQHLITEKQTIEQAVENTMKEVGPDPACNNTLEYYPLESGNYAIQR
jgi:hypothetical protein